MTYYATDPTDPAAPVELTEWNGLTVGMAVDYVNPRAGGLPGPITLSALYQMGLGGPVVAILNEGEFEVMARNLKPAAATVTGTVVSGPRFPEITVALLGHDGNAFAILGAVTRALRIAGVPRDEVDRYTTEATSGDYDNLLAVTMRWVDVQ